MSNNAKQPDHPRWPVVAADEIEAVERVLRSGQLNYWTGDEGRLFEQEYAEFVGQPHAIAVANGTVALELALRALGIGQGDEVVVPSRTFIATASSVASCGAVPVCADIDRDSQNLTPQTIAEKLSPRTKAIIPVHLAGWPCDMPSIMNLAETHGLLVIEDCAQAHGAEILGKQVGSFGDAAAFSFCQDKILTTGGEGGMVLFRDTAAWKRAWSHKDHGKDFEAVHAPKQGPGFRWLHHAFGTNGRMTEMQAAIGRQVLAKLPAWLRQREENARLLTNGLSSHALLRTPVRPTGIRHANYKWYTFVRSERLTRGWDRDRVMHEINQLGTPCFSGSCGEIYRERAFVGLHPEGLRLPVARELGETSLMFLVDPTQTASRMQKAVGDTLRVLDAACAAHHKAA